MKKRILAIFMLTMILLTGSQAQASPVKQTGKTMVYASLDRDLLYYELDAANAALNFRGSVRLPANLQFAAVDPSGRFLYAVSSNAGSGTYGAAGDLHVLSAFKIDQKSGDLQEFGASLNLPERPIHVTVDRKGEYALVAFNKSGTVKVYKIAAEGFLIGEVAQAETPDGGIFTHQVVVTPANKTVIALGRGNEAGKNKPADIGSVTTFAFDKGMLNQISKEYFEDGVGPRHLAFHPTKPWVYVGIERTSKVFQYELKTDGTMGTEPLFRKETLIDLANVHRNRQKGGCIQIHPNGKILYVTNRADGTIKEGDKTLWAGGENNIAVYSIDQKTGEPTLIQHIDSQGMETRTFTVDPTGSLFLAANQKTMWVRTGEKLEKVPANFALFRIGSDGKLKFVRKYIMEDGDKWLLWSDMLELK